MSAALKIEELDAVFAALREKNQEKLGTALDNVIVLAKHKGMDAKQLQETLSFYGFEGTEKFNTWLKDKF